MNIYYAQAEYESGKHKILKTWAEAFGLNVPAIKEAYSVLQIDEYYNRKLATLLFHNNRSEFDLPDRFYVDNNGNLRDNSNDSIVSIEVNPQKAAYKLSQLYGLTQAQLQTYIDNNVTNLAEAKTFLKKLSAVVLWLIKQTRLDEE